MDRRQPRNISRGPDNHIKRIENFSNEPFRSRGGYHKDNVSRYGYDRERYSQYSAYDAPRPMRSNYLPRNAMRIPPRNSRFRGREYPRASPFNGFLRRHNTRQDSFKRHLTKEELDENIKKYMRGEMMK